jgi:hypothetical protein
VTPFWRHLLMTVVLAGVAGFAGVWVGARRLAPPPPSPPMLPSVVSELTSRGMQDISVEQERRLNEIAARYETRRVALRHGIVAANFELANALAEEMTMGPRTQASIDRLKESVGDLQQAAIEYVLALRQVLTAEQQTVFDTKVVEALMTDPR